MKKKLIALLAVCMLTATLTACGGSTSDETDDMPDTNAAAEADDEGYYDEEEDYAEENYAEEAAEDSGEFTLLDVSADMIEAGVYAIDDEQDELVFSMFTTPSGTAMASLFVFCPDCSGDVICGSYSAESETDEAGILWTKLNVSDVYTGNTYNIGFAEGDGQVYIFNAAGTVYEGKYLTADETVTYMGTAVALMS